MDNLQKQNPDLILNPELVLHRVLGDIKTKRSRDEQGNVGLLYGNPLWSLFLPE
ncbi:MAG: hypothetical protein KGJ02_04850 [Verrucomicrobiota bacterium]|nr:hypothetical protein [Verrucomicrobiota bacterium]